MAFRFDKLTIKAQEAVAARAGAGGRARAIRRSSRCICWPRCLAEDEGIVRPAARKDRRQSSASSNTIVEAELKHLAASRAAASPPGVEPAARQGARRRPGRSRRHEGRLRLDRAPAARARQGRLESQERPASSTPSPKKKLLDAHASRPRLGPRHRSDARGQIPGPAKNTASIWSSGPGKASSIRSSAAIRKSAA